MIHRLGRRGRLSAFIDCADLLAEAPRVARTIYKLWFETFQIATATSAGVAVVSAITAAFEYIGSN
jgi:hypothetical protein